MKFLPRIRKKPKLVNSETLEETLTQKLSDYYNKEELKEYLDQIRSDERKKAAWASLSELKKIKLLRFVLKKKGESGGKK